MTSIGYNTGLRALLSSQFALNTVGHNISNANTLGYSRQQIHFGTSSPLASRGVLIGTGVNALDVQRGVDQLLNRRIFSQVSVSGSLQTQLGGMTEIEALFGEPEGNSVGSMLDDFFTSISELSTAPEDAILRTGAVQSAVALTSQFNLLDTGLENVVQDRRAELSTKVSEVNDFATKIAQLNVRIGESLANGLSPNDLYDERDRALRGLAGIVDFKTVQGPNDAIGVLVAGNTLVSSAHANRMTVTTDNTGKTALQVVGASGFVPVTGGAIGGLLEVSRSLGPDLRGQIDQLARNLILESNRVHSVGVPAGGPFTSLTAQNSIKDRDQDGSLRDELLSNSGLPFDISNGVLSVNVTNMESGDVVRSEIAISKTHTTVQDLLDSVNAIDNLSADIDGFGRLRLISNAGHGFDFSSRIDPSPDAEGTFGGGRATLGSGASAPFALADGDTLSLTVDPSGAAVPLTVTFATADFDEISEATADEIAAVINGDSAAQAAGIVANVVGEQVYLQSISSGATQSFRLDGGTAVATMGLGFAVGTTTTGQDNTVDVEIQGLYTGAGDEVFTFRPNMDGTIGTTPGLAIDVFDASGERISTLEVGVGYQPGSELEIGEGLRVSFGLGEISATNNDAFELEVVDDPDTTDVLVALGLNSLFVGSDAETIGVREDIVADPSLLSSSKTGSSGDSSLLLDLLDVDSKGIGSLGGATIGQFYGNIVGDTGFEVASTNSALQSNDILISSLDLRRDQVAGVNVDEELVDLLQYEQSFAAAAQFITVVNQLNDELLSLI